MGKKIEEEGSTLIVSDSEDFDNLDAESMLEDIEEAPDEYIGEAEAQEIVDSIFKREEKVRVEFRERGTDNVFSGVLTSYSEHEVKATFKARIHYMLEVKDEELLNFPIRKVIDVDEVNFVYGDVRIPTLEEDVIMSFTLANLERKTPQEFTVFIQLT